MYVEGIHGNIKVSTFAPVFEHSLYSFQSIGTDTTPSYYNLQLKLVQLLDDGAGRALVQLKVTERVGQERFVRREPEVRFPVVVCPSVIDFVTVIASLGVIWRSTRKYIGWAGGLEPAASDLSDLAIGCLDFVEDSFPKTVRSRRLA